MSVMCVQRGRVAMAAGMVAAISAAVAAGDVTVFDNGQFITGPGTGVTTGFNVSRAESQVATIGFNADALPSQGGPLRVMDDFTIAGAPPGGLSLSTMTFYGVQSNTVTSDVHFQKFYVALFDGPPFAGGNLIAGDFATNRLLSSEFSGVYRLPSGNGTPFTNWPITTLTVDMSWAPRLSNGTYWMEVSAAGDSSIAATPNPQTIFVTPHPANANAEQLFNGQWYAIWDLPFVLHAFCPGDFNRSHTLEVQDIFDFLNAWLAGNPSADFNGGGLAVQDIFDFLNAWFAGC